MNNNLKGKNLKQNILDYVFNLLISGFKFCIVGHPKNFSTKKLKKFLESRGHCFFSSDTEAAIFLASNSQLNKSHNIPKIILLLKPGARNVNYFKILGFSVIDTTLGIDEVDLLFSEILYILSKVSNLTKS